MIFQHPNTRVWGALNFTLSKQHTHTDKRVKTLRWNFIVKTMRMPFEVLGYVPDNRNLKCSDLSSVQMTQGLPEPHDPTFNCFYFWGSWLSPMPLTQNMKTGCRYAQLIRLHILSKTSVASLATDWWMEPRPPAYVIWKFLPAWQIAGFTHTPALFQKGTQVITW